MRELQQRSTNDVDPSQRVRYWRDALHEAVVEMDLAPSANTDYYGQIELCPLSNIVPHHAQGSRQKISRDRVAISRSEKHVYYLVSQPGFPWWCVHAGQEHLIQKGQTVLLDSSRPYLFDFDKGFESLSVELPVEWVIRWIPEPDKIIGQPIQCDNGWGLALRGAKEALRPSNLVSFQFPDELIEDQLGALLALAAGIEFPSLREKDAMFSSCVEVIRSRLTIPGLVASEVARECAISLRTLHRIFAAQGKTFAGFLMEKRIEEAVRMLADQRFRHLTIAEIGRRCGFLDQSHFARQFYRLRQLSPSSYRSRLGG